MIAILGLCAIILPPMAMAAAIGMIDWLAVLGIWVSPAGWLAIAIMRGK